MIFLFAINILCTSNVYEETKKQNNEDKNIINLNSGMDQNLSLTHFNSEIEKIKVGYNKRANDKFNIEMIPKKNNIYFQNFDSSSLSSNYEYKRDLIYASKINSQTKINAHNPTADTDTNHNKNNLSFNSEHISDAYNFYKSIKQTPPNENISANNFDNLESINSNSNNQVIKENKLYQSASEDNDEKYFLRYKYSQKEENLPEQLFDYLDLNIFQFDKIVTNNDFSEIERNAEFDEVFKLIERDQELIKEENEKQKQNIIPTKRARIENDLDDINSNIANPTIKKTFEITQQPQPFNNKFNFPKPTETLKSDQKPMTSKFNKILNKNIEISETKVFNKSRLNFRPILPKISGQTNDFLNNHNISTYSPSNNYEINSTRNIEIDFPYDNDFDSPNFSLDFLNSYIADLNKNYSEKCENIFLVVADRISEVLFRLRSENKFNDSDRSKRPFSYRCYLKINISVGYILTEILDKNIPFYIFTNNFVKINNDNLDISKSKYAGYNIFRTKEQENDAFNSLISEIELKYGNEAKKLAKSAYNNFLEKLNPDILVLIEKIYNGQVNNKRATHSNINKVFYAINNLIQFKNVQLTEVDSLIIYKVLKSISKFLRQTSEDSFLTSVFPEFRIINLLYHSRINDHHISGRKFHAGIFLKKILKQKLEDFKEKYQTAGRMNNLDNIYFKEILEIRVFYFFTLFKFLNIKKPYLLAYILLSIRSYLLKSEKINYIEKNEFEKIFSLHVINLDEILYKQLFIHLKP
ncbi:hypothetical protein DMUE_0216 [Dictyocoela muelleri]|nr:hypothetical protein DMUE_0216 [Dictyocoela muelleri]